VLLRPWRVVAFAAEAAGVVESASCAFTTAG
jgi:hypothetical protein